MEDNLVVVRMHGRDAETWEKPGLKPSERYKYLYSEKELEEWATRIRDMAGQTKQMHVLFNNNYEDYAVRNAMMMQQLLMT